MWRTELRSANPLNRNTDVQVIYRSELLRCAVSGRNPEREQYNESRKITEKKNERARERRERERGCCPPQCNDEPGAEVVPANPCASAAKASWWRELHSFSSCEHSHDGAHTTYRKCLHTHTKYINSHLQAFRFTLTELQGSYTA